ncbi:MAG TPA: type I DNA topoisomerase [Candidatus Limnocylindrales bacterium]
MSGNLVIVESPAKAKTIERYLGPGYTVLASYGHVRDLPENPGKGELGVDVEHDFAPTYEVPADRRRQVTAIARAASRADAIYLATDLDREGEAIAWHVAEAVGLPTDKTRRVTFSEITEPAIKRAFAHPRQIDLHLVDAQQARRVVDRLVGYTLSPLLWRKVRAGLSAGRVQSVAVRLVVDREREIRAFTAREYWTIEADLVAPDGTVFAADLVRLDGQKPEVGDEATASAIVEGLRAAHPVVRGVTTRRANRSPAPPFTTSSLQQEASRKLGFSPKRTMSVAQRLYEGVETAEGQVGLITYMRTDSVAMAGQALGEAREVITARFGERYAMPKGRPFKNKARHAQEAHEAIRPTSFARDPEVVGRTLGRDEARLYRLIWQRALASQMAAKEQETTSIELADGPYELRASATRTTFDGFSRIYTEGRDDDGSEEPEAQLPTLAEGDATSVAEVRPEQHFTEPPPRYTEASLVKALEENGIGRPSTYAATISTIVDRGYVTVKERRLHPEPVAEIVTDLLVEHFSRFVDLAFTASMEADLDEVASGKRGWVPLVRDFYGPLKEQVDTKRRELRRSDFTTRPTDEVCSEGHPMVVRLGRYGEFLACSKYPEHKETRPLPGDEPGGDGTAAAAGDGAAPAAPAGVGEACPVCGEAEGGVLVAKRGRFGPFVGCSRYPDCDYIKRDGPPPPPPLAFEVTCPTCHEGHLVARRARRTGSVFWGCSRYPRCDFTTSREPLGPVHEADEGPVARNGEGAICLACGAPIELPPDGPVPGARLPGGQPNPAALANPRRGRGGSRGASTRSSPRRTGGRSAAGGRSTGTRRARQA